MKPRKLKIGTRVSLAWLDAHGPEGWVKIEDLSLTMPPVWVCGIVVGVSKDALAVSPAMMGTHCVHPIVIPWFAIRQLKKLK